MIRALLATVLMLLAAGAWAQNPLSRAVDRFEALVSGPTNPVQAEEIAARISLYEATLADLRQAYRAARFRETSLSRKFAAQEARLLRALEAQITLAQTGSAVALTHPDGPLAALRAEMLLGEISDNLRKRVALYRGDLDALEALRGDIRVAETSLTRGLAALQQLRLALSQRAVVADAGPFDQSASDLELLEQVVARAATSPVAAEALEGIIGADWSGNMALPVTGRLKRGFGEPDTRGIARPGILIDTESGAMAKSPATATIRHVGTLENFGALIILEPAPGYLLILAGLDLVLVAEGDVVNKDQGLGFLSGVSSAHKEFSSIDAPGAGGNHPQTLYMELRENGEPIDPAVWFTF